MSDWIKGTVVKNIHWKKNLCSLILHAPINNFIAGQYTKLALEINHERVQRAYSYVNAPNEKNLEFYLVYIPKGTLTAKLFTLKSNDIVMIDKNSSGFFTLNSIPKSKTLWMLSTGTAIGPYLSILQEKKNLEEFYNIVLVHAVRFFSDLSYLPLMLKLKEFYNTKLKIQIVLSREMKPGCLNGRIPELIKNKKLERAVDLEINHDSHIMLCGNPNMVKETQKLLQDIYDMKKNLKNKPGHITTENYW